jgi:Ni/Fe-hydrogenase subunit HybB-like protein
VVCGFALLAFGRFTLRCEPGRGRPAWVLVTYCILFAVVGSVWAFDFIVMPSPGLTNTLAGPYLFVGSFVSGLAFMTIGALRAGTLDQGQRRDAAMLIVSMAIFWAYLFWSQLLTFWYGHLPEELAFLSRRTAGIWAIVSGLVVVTTLVVPFAALLGERGKRSRRRLYVAAASQLVGLWLERELLIAPAMTAGWTLRSDLLGALTQFGMAAVFVLYTWPWAERTAPATSLVSPGTQAAAEG